MAALAMIRFRILRMRQALGPVAARLCAPVLAVLVLAAAAAAGPALAGQRLEQVTVRVLPSAEVTGESYTLGEIAELDSFDMAAVQRLAAVEMGRSPRPGYGIRLHEAYLRSRLVREIDPERLKLIVPEQARVTRAFQRIESETIVQRVLRAASQAAPEGGGDLEQEVLNPPDAVDLPVGEVRWQIDPVGRNLSPGSTRSFQVAAVVDGEIAWRHLMRVKQALYRDVVVARRPVRRNDVVAPDDVAVERQEVGRMQEGSYLTRADEVVGKRARRPIGPGEWVRADMVQAPADVKEGRRVMVVYRTPRLLMKVPGVAMAGGRVGDFIPVRNLQSGVIVYGVVQPDDVVQVN